MPKMSVTRLEGATLSGQPFRFSGTAGRRYGLEIVGIFAIKLPLLLLLWIVAVRPSMISPGATANSVARIYYTEVQAKPHD